MAVVIFDNAGSDPNLAWAHQEYIEGRVEVEELELLVERALAGEWIIPWSAAMRDGVIAHGWF